jgi:antitoxin MazE
MDVLCIFIVETKERFYMRIKIQKWGNSLALRIPKAFAFQSRIRQDEYVNLTLDNDKIIVEPVEEKKYSLKKLVSGINKSNLHSEIDFGKKVGAERW